MRAAAAHAAHGPCVAAHTAAAREAGEWRAAAGRAEAALAQAVAQAVADRERYAVCLGIWIRVTLERVWALVTLNHFVLQQVQFTFYVLVRLVSYKRLIVSVLVLER